MQPVDSPDDEIDRLIIRLRAYVERADGGGQRASQNKTKQNRATPSGWVLVFDCETTVTPDQRLRFGAYQLRYRGRLVERGLFHENSGLEPGELATLSAFMCAEQPGPDGEKLFLRSREQFVHEVLYRRAFLIGAEIVGFNLPFDLSRLAICHVDSRGGMKGGFTFILAEDETHPPNISIKHLSARAALIKFIGVRPRRDSTASEPSSGTDRGYFVDVRTAASALLSGSHSLKSLSEHLGVPTPKIESEDHGERLTPDYIRYGQRDVQTTWECYDALSRRLDDLNLPGVGLHELYSEASLGKAYLRTMGVNGWREVQSDFPPQITGHIMSGYFGGRAEVHIRRQIVEVLHCDFMSMYPTVCTLMGLWEFIRADGADWHDDTNAVRARIDACDPDSLKGAEGWTDLTAIVQVLPDDDLFPVRAEYGEGAATIGLNRLSADEPHWFTLADVLVSKVLTGRAPKVLRAIRFSPRTPQGDLRPMTVAGATFDPASADFFKTLVDHRRAILSRVALDPSEKAVIDRDQKAIKILANATSYGIFVELNEEETTRSKPQIGYGRADQSFKFTAREFEKPGQYFHPLLGALITGAARLMLALAERRVQALGLDWAFCDTDSLAIANVAGLSSQAFRQKADQVVDWFSDLNPYAVKGSILQYEKVNDPVPGEVDPTGASPLYCLAVSAKRYVLFNRGADGGVVIRKASGHGLGHLIDPYNDPPDANRSHIDGVGVPRWQSDFWRRIIVAADAGTPDQVDLDDMAGFDAPAASRYAATKPALLSWFDRYNERQPSYALSVKPFNFMLSLQAESSLMNALGDATDTAGGGSVRPAAPYMRDVREAVALAFDRVTGDPVPARLLKTTARSLVRYHMHEEQKFRGGGYDQTGFLARRRVFAIAVQSIGKEADDIEEEAIDEAEPPDEYAMSGSDLQRLRDAVSAAQTEGGFSDRMLIEKAGVSRRTLIAFRAGRKIDRAGAVRLATAAETLRRKAASTGPKTAGSVAGDLAADMGGAAALAREIGLTRQYVNRILKGERPISEQVARRIQQAQTRRSRTLAEDADPTDGRGSE